MNIAKTSKGNGVNKMTISSLAALFRGHRHVQECVHVQKRPRRTKTSHLLTDLKSLHKPGEGPCKDVKCQSVKVYFNIHTELLGKCWEATGSKAIFLVFPITR